MTTEALYSRACIPDRFSILGKRLEPFSIGHTLLLERVDSPFFNGGDITAQDLCVAVWICSQRFEQAERTIFNRASLAWKWLAFRFWIVTVLKPSVIEERAILFTDYIRASQYDGPEPTLDDKQTTKSTCPWLIMLKRDLMGELGYSESEVLNMTQAQAIMERYGILEKAGVLKFTGEGQKREPGFWEECDRIARELNTEPQPQEAHGVS